MHGNRDLRHEHDTNFNDEEVEIGQRFHRFKNPDNSTREKYIK